MRYEQKAELQDSNKQKMYEEKEKQQSVRLKKFDQELKEQFEEQANSMSKQKLIDFYVETMIEGEQEMSSEKKNKQTNRKEQAR